MDKIDFVITWVDGNDIEWQQKKQKYESRKNDKDANNIIRYRDYGLLKYWFRSIEKFAPWVNKIYLITDHQVPKWLRENDKLIVVFHDDYIPEKYLPTFNSNVIELFMHRIKGLSEHFVYFNDDMYIVDDVNVNDFFVNSLPCDQLVFNSVSVEDKNNIVEHIILNNLELVSNSYSKKEVIKNGKRKVFNIKYGKSNIRNFLLLPWKKYTGMYNPHVPIAYRKSTIEEVWSKYGEELLSTAEHKFRSKLDYSHWLYRYYQLLSLDFVPKSNKRSCYYSVENNNSLFLSEIKKHKYNMICINDNDETVNFDTVKEELVSFFDDFLPEKSSFEKD